MSSDAPRPAPMIEPGHILVVDDDRVLNEFMSALLRLDLHSVSQALSGAEAFGILQTQNVDLVLTDLMMPGETGIELIARMKTVPRLAAIPTILISAIKETVDRGAVMTAGADDFLSKPVNKAELRARVRALLRLKRAHDALEASLAEKAAVLSNFDQRFADLKERHKTQLAAIEQKVKAEAVGVFSRYADHHLRPPVSHALALLGEGETLSADAVQGLRDDLARISAALDRLRADHSTALQLADLDAQG